MTCTSTKIRLMLSTSCTCKAYSYPHDAKRGLCSVDFILNPPKIQAPKRGKAATLCSELAKLEAQIIDIGSEALLDTLKDIKKLLLF